MKPSGAAAGEGGRSRLVRDASGYMAATYVSQALAFGIGIVTKGLLGPADLGTWTLLLAVLSFMGLLEFGVIQASNKEIAYATSKGDAQAAALFKGTQFSFIAITSLLGTAALAAYAVTVSHAQGGVLWAGLLAIALILPASQMHMGQVTVFWAHQKFSTTGSLIMFETLLMGTVGLLLIWGFQLVGQVAAFALVLGAKIAVLAWRAASDSHLQIRFEWSGSAFRRLLGVGIPLQINNLVNVVKFSGTVFLISHYFDTSSVGFYSLALSVQNFIYWTPNAFSIVMFPRFQERFAASDDKAEALHSYLVKPVIGLAFFLLPILISVTYFLFPPLIDHALPAYRPSVDILSAMLIGTFFLSLEHMPGQLLTTANRPWQKVLLSVISLGLLGGFAAVAIVSNLGLIGFVLAVSLANMCSFLLSFASAHALAQGSTADRWFVLKVVGAFLYLVIDLVLVDRLAFASQGLWWVDVLQGLARCGVALVVLAPLFVVAERNLSLLSAFRRLTLPRTKAPA
jgi:O-antigen/teichoic acid export membrane protein